MDASVEFLAVACRFALGAVFITAGLGKLGRRREFQRAVRGYGLVPARLAPAVAAALPPVELILGALLAAGVAVPSVAMTVALLLSLFTFAVSFNLVRGRKIDCGCFGVGIPRTITWMTVLRNLALGAIAVFVALSMPRALSVDGVLFGATGATSHSDALAILVATAVGLLILSLLAEIRRLRAATSRIRGVIS